MEAQRPGLSVHVDFSLLACLKAGVTLAVLIAVVLERFPPDWNPSAVDIVVFRLLP